MLGLQLGQLLHQRIADQRVAEVDAGAVEAALAEDGVGQRDRRVALGLELLKLGDRIADQLVDRDIVVGDAVDEAGVGAVLEQAADEIGEQFLVAADRRVDAHRGRLFADAAFELGQLLVEPLAHAVQALEFERGVAGQRLHRADGVGVVGGEGRVDAVARGEHAAWRRRGS